MPMLNDRNTIDQLLKNKQLFDLNGVARITGYNPRYLRRLCHAKRVDHQQILGRYYMTPKEVADLMTPVKKIAVKTK